jgi:hypothetical protein
MIFYFFFKGVEFGEEYEIKTSKNDGDDITVMDNYGMFFFFLIKYIDYFVIIKSI